MRGWRLALLMLLLGRLAWAQSLGAADLFVGPIMPVGYLETVVVSFQERTEISQRRVWYESPQRYRIDLLHHDGTQTTYYSDGERTIFLPPNSNAAFAGPLRIFPSISGENRTYSHLSREWLMGRMTGKVSLDHGDGRLTHYWIDLESYLILREERYGREGELLYLMIRSDLRFDSGMNQEIGLLKLAREMVLITDPEQWRLVTSLQQVLAWDEFSVYLPTLSGDWTFETAEFVELDGARHLVIRYRYRRQLISFYQRPAIPGERERFRADEEKGIYQMFRGEMVFTLVGALDRQQATRFFNTLMSF